MPNFENYFAYSFWQYDFVSHMLALTVAVFASGFVYFISSRNQVAPQFRMTNTISAVVMVSAFLEIGQLFLSWGDAFTLTAAGWAPSGEATFSNGFRYVNWSIDVPMLLTQLLIVLGLTNERFWAEWWKLSLAGILMIWTGYPGQFFEPAVAGLAPGQATAPFWIWGAISTVFFVYLLYRVGMLIGRPPEPQSEQVRRNFMRIWVLILASWALYPIAYGLPAVWADANAAVTRQALFTIADITSKLVFGVMLSRIAVMRSEEIGFRPETQAGGRENTA